MATKHKLQGNTHNKTRQRETHSKLTAKTCLIHSVSYTQSHALSLMHSVSCEPENQSNKPLSEAEAAVLVSPFSFIHSLIP